MGSCCGTQSASIDINNVLRLQALARRFLQKKKVDKERKEFIIQIASNQSIFDQFLENKRPQLKAGVNTTANMLTNAQVERLMTDQTKRILINSEEIVKPNEVGEQSKNYRGQWKLINGKAVKDGVGRMKWADGSVYEGQFNDDKMVGTGQMTQANGDLYQGQWKNNMANGTGIFVDTLGSTYDGQWVDDMQHGFGKESWQAGAIKFEGNYIQGRKEGQGKYEWQDGSYYQGEFVNSCFHGQGVYYTAESEKTFEGNFAQNQFEGKGKLTFKDGRTFTGDFKANKKDGQGTMTFSNGNKYIGGWKEDVQHGIGIFYNAEDGTKKQGEWREGKRKTWLNKK